MSGTLVSRVGPRPPPTPLDPKSDRRDAWQVGANGGPAAVAAGLISHADLTLWVVTASLAAAAADTWATAIGAHSRVSPRLLWSGQRVVAGTSGGVTPAGSAGGFAGAAVVSAAGGLAADSAALFALGTMIGFAGMLVDSLIGGSLQGRFHCRHCDQPSEWRSHRCGNPSEWKGGLTWLTNDGVNFMATALAAGLGWAAWIASE